jgi:hypothetical protein
LDSQVTVQLSAPEAARRLSKTKGLPYRTYINLLVHEALERESTEVRRSGRARKKDLAAR